MNSYIWYLGSETNEKWSWSQVFSKEECEKIISDMSKLPKESGKVFVDSGETFGEQTPNSNIRISNISWIPANSETDWIFRRCTDFIISNNSKYFNYDLTHIENLQFTAYDSTGSYYGKHCDAMLSNGAGGSRKLSFSVQLSDPESYEGGDLALYYSKDPVIAKRDHGMATFFPSTMLHEVTPITSGIRYSLVGWVAGPKFK